MEPLPRYVVATLLLGIACGPSGCKTKDKPKDAPPARVEDDSPTPPGSLKTNVVYRKRDGCFINTKAFYGHTDLAWNSYEIDCPPNLLDAGEAPADRQRPAGKEDWIRIRSSLVYQPYKKKCAFNPERFCTPQGRPAECTPFPPTVDDIPCTEAGADKMTFGTFVYADGLGGCRKVSPGTCTTGRSGGCDPPSGDIVPCPRDE